MRLQLLVKDTEDNFNKIVLTKTEYKRSKPAAGKPLIEKISKSMKKFNDDKIVVTFHIEGGNESAASVLSSIYSNVVEFYNNSESFLILESGFSEYYNKILYPLYNKFERYIRKLVYWSPVQDQTIEEKRTSINNKDLEELDFGALYQLLFVDKGYCLCVKSKVNEIIGNDKNFSGKTKREIMEFLQSEEENTLWMQISNGNEKLKTISDNFTAIKKYRNDVMHAHNINEHEYKESRKIIDEVNEILSCEINKYDPSSKMFEIENMEKLSGIAKNINKLHFDDSSHIYFSKSFKSNTGFTKDQYIESLKHLWISREIEKSDIYEQIEEYRAELYNQFKNFNFNYDEIVADSTLEENEDGE